MGSGSGSTMGDIVGDAVRQAADDVNDPPTTRPRAGSRGSSISPHAGMTRPWSDGAPDGHPSVGARPSP